ncbi:DUF2335 domain-containing protein [Kingella kingae]|nr:DUF2335 domain-containing protein [Kingella kingae]MDK4555417.1 DUF2335 domain-containing protein [Kingella kingae]MDK4587186.1 DUF2335 domain-containing protein [Kingella kingae]MDK4588441.1 DUF2335 domain-containing protein [Kingella kingae]MDK4596631.1 DUF2335 domain-containing protein [Kingella kingae]MDK4600588.1 DUF2335 domain-containing protein [Kingella kingae]
MESSKQEIVQTVVNNPELLNEVISTQEAQTVLIQRAEMSFHQGPLPSPKSVAEYAQTIPDFGERIMAYMEKEQAARHDLARQSVTLNRMGLWFGFIALCVITGFCIFLAFLGFVQAAAWVMVAVLAAVVGTFVIGKREHKQSDN